MSEKGGQDRKTSLWKIAAVACCGPFLAQLDTTLVNMALTKLGDVFEAPLSAVQWVVSGYLLSLALMLPLTGWLVERAGCKAVYLGCFAVFTASAAMCSLATSVEMLIAFRVLQGMAGGLMAPMAHILVARQAGNRVSYVLSFIALPVAIGPALGPAIGGYILQHFSWHWLFLVNLPIGVTAILLAWFLLPADEPGHSRRLDLVGFALIAPGLVLLLNGLNSLSVSGGVDPVAWAQVVASPVILAVFVLHSLRLGQSALIDLRLLAIRTFSASAVTQFLSNATTVGGQMLMPLYLVTILHMQPSEAGLLIVPSAIGLMASRPYLARWTMTYGPRRVCMSGAAIGLCATLPFALHTHWLPPFAIAMLLFCRGFGLAIINVPSATSAYSTLPFASLTQAATVINIAQRLGGPTATVLIAIAIHSAATGAGGLETAMSDPGVFAYSTAFYILCFFNVLCLLCACMLPKQMGFKVDAGMGS